MHPFSSLIHSHRTAAYAAGGVLAALAAGAVLLLRRRPTPEQIEARRRDRLAASGRITDGSLIDALPGLNQPQTIIYRYRIAGVTYECSQDVTAISCGLALPALDLPIQVRYDRDNPGDSIVLAEAWNGLWSLPPAPSDTQPGLH